MRQAFQGVILPYPTLTPGVDKLYDWFITTEGAEQMEAVFG